MGPWAPTLLLVVVVAAALYGCWQRRCYAQQHYEHHPGPRGESSAYFQTMRVNANMSFNTQVVINEGEIFSEGQRTIPTVERQGSALRQSDEGDIVPYDYQHHGDLAPFLRPRA